MHADIKAVLPLALSGFFYFSHIKESCCGEVVFIINAHPSELEQEHSRLMRFYLEQVIELTLHEKYFFADMRTSYKYTKLVLLVILLHTVPEHMCVGEIILHWPYRPGDCIYSSHSHYKSITSDRYVHIVDISLAAQQDISQNILSSVHCVGTLSPAPGTSWVYAHWAALPFTLSFLGPRSHETSPVCWQSEKTLLDWTLRCQHGLQPVCRIGVGQASAHLLKLG